MQALQATMQELLPRLPVIRRIIDSLAMLDMLASFAQVPRLQAAGCWLKLA